MRLRALAGLLVVAGVAVGPLVVLGRQEVRGSRPGEAPLPLPPAPAFTVATPRPLVEATPVARWSAVLGPSRSGRSPHRTRTS